MRSALETGFHKMLGLYGLESWCEQEYRFAAPRRYRFDFAWPELKIAIELDGATWANGRHNRGYGIESDHRKRNLAQMLGWKVYTYTRSMIESGEAIRDLQEILSRLDSGSKKGLDTHLRCTQQPPESKVMDGSRAESRDGRRNIAVLAQSRILAPR